MEQSPLYQTLDNESPKPDVQEVSDLKRRRITTLAKKGSQDDLKESSSMRIQKALAQLGVGSRRWIEKAIQENRIEVNNAPAHVGQAVSSKDKIVFDGKLIRTE